MRINESVGLTPGDTLRLYTSDRDTGEPAPVGLGVVGENGTVELDAGLRTLTWIYIADANDN